MSWTTLTPTSKGGTEMLQEGPEPKYAQLRDHIAEISVPGKLIPSERDLMERFGVSRGTVRKAVDELVALGALKRVHGKGTFATEPRVESNLHLASFTQDMRRRGLVPSSRILELVIKPLGHEGGRALGLDPDSDAWHLRRIRIASGQPLALEEARYPAAAFPKLDSFDLGERSLYEVFATHYDTVIDTAEQTLWGEAADADLARLLEVPPMSPLLVFERVSSTRGRAIEYIRSYYLGERYQVHMSLTADNGTT